MSDWGTPHRLSDDSNSVTTKGGALHISKALAKLTIDFRTFVLPFGQKVVTTEGVAQVKDLTAGESSIAMVSNHPTSFGNVSIPYTALILGVMSFSYDENYRMVSWDFSESQRERILQAIPHVTKELGLEQNWTMYPNFVRVSSTDGTQRWVLTSSMFEHVREACVELGVLDNTNLEINADTVTKNSIASWIEGMSFGNRDDLHPRWEQLRKPLNFNVHPTPNEIEHFRVSPFPVHLTGRDFHTVTDITELKDTEALLFRFETDYWVYPQYDDPTNRGVLCASLNIQD